MKEEEEQTKNLKRKKDLKNLKKNPWKEKNKGRRKNSPRHPRSKKTNEGGRRIVGECKNSSILKLKFHMNFFSISDCHHTQLEFNRIEF